MRILVLANFGMGLYKFRKELLESLVHDGHEVIVSFPSDEYVNPIVELGCKFVDVKLERRGMNPIKDIRLIFTYFNLMKNIQPDVVLTYTIKPNIYGGIVSSLLNIRYIPNITGAGNAIENGGLLAILVIDMYKLSLKKAGKVFFQNQYNLNTFQQNGIIKSNQPILIPGSGVNTSEFNYKTYPRERTMIRILYIGRILENKGINELLEAIKYIKLKYSHVKFDIVGFCEEEYENTLYDFEEKGLLTFHGQQDDILPYLENCHAIIQPSYHEGMSNVLLEAASSGRPILASRVPGCQETFDEGVSGIGFEAKDTKSLIESLEEFLLLSYEEKLEMGKMGRKKMLSQFNRDIIIEAYKKVINNNLEVEINE